MTRRSREVGIIKSCILGAALAACLALPAQAGDKKLALSATAAFTTDYVFRGISQTAEGPAAQPEFDLTYGMFYAGIWGSNLDFGGGPNGQDLASIEIDYYAGITPKWKGITFNIGGIYYSYPGACETQCGTANNDYFELKTGASYTFFEQLTLGLTNYWSPDYTLEVGDNDVLELAVAYAFRSKLFNFFSPTISGLYGHQWGDESEGGVDYNYWNAGLTLGFMDHWSVDVRYWDSDLSFCQSSGLFSCDARAVGTVKAVF